MAVDERPDPARAVTGLAIRSLLRNGKISRRLVSTVAQRGIVKDDEPIWQVATTRLVSRAETSRECLRRRRSEGSPNRQVMRREPPTKPWLPTTPTRRPISLTSPVEQIDAARPSSDDPSTDRHEGRVEHGEHGKINPGGHLAEDSAFDGAVTS